MSIAEALLLQVLLHCHLLSQPTAQKDLSVAALADWLDDLDLVLGNEKGELDSAIFEVLRDLGCMRREIHCMLMRSLRMRFFLLSLELEEEELDISSTYYRTSFFSYFCFRCWMSRTNSIVRCFFANSAIGSLMHWLLKIILRNYI